MGRINWRRVPIQFIPMTVPTCPTCCATDLIHWGSRSNGDSTRTRKFICRKCSTAFVAVFEPEFPQRGNYIETPDTILKR